MNKPFVKFTMLDVEPGREFTLTFPSDGKASDLAKVLAPHMKNCIISNVSEADEADNQRDFDLCWDIVWNVTDGDPLADLTEDDAVRLIKEAQDEGYTIPSILTPELFLELFDTMKGE